LLLHSVRHEDSKLSGFSRAGAVTIAIALLTISWQAMKAATANPVVSLKTE